MRKLQFRYNSVVNTLVQGLKQPLWKQGWGMEVSKLLPMISMYVFTHIAKAIFAQEMGCSTPSIFSKSTVTMMYVKRIQKLMQKRLFHQSMLDLKGLVYDFVTI